MMHMRFFGQLMGFGAVGVTIAVAASVSCSYPESGGSDLGEDCLEFAVDLCPLGTSPNLSAEAIDACGGRINVDVEHQTGEGEVWGRCQSYGSCEVFCEILPSFCPCGVKALTKDELLCNSPCGEEEAPSCPSECDPLDRDCADESQWCYPVGEGFGCEDVVYGNASGDVFSFGNPCQTVNSCGSHSFCVFDHDVESCSATTDVGCCSSYCDRWNLCPGDLVCVPFSNGCSPSEGFGFCANG